MNRLGVKGGRGIWVRKKEREGKIPLAKQGWFMWYDRERQRKRESERKTDTLWLCEYYWVSEWVSEWVSGWVSECVCVSLCVCVCEEGRGGSCVVCCMLCGVWSVPCATTPANERACRARQITTLQHHQIWLPLTCVTINRHIQYTYTTQMGYACMSYSCKGIPFADSMTQLQQALKFSYKVYRYQRWKADSGRAEILVPASIWYGNLCRNCRPRLLQQRLLLSVRRIGRCWSSRLSASLISSPLLFTFDLMSTPPLIRGSFQMNMSLNTSYNLRSSYNFSISWTCSGL